MAEDPREGRQSVFYCMATSKMCKLEGVKMFFFQIFVEQNLIDTEVFHWFSAASQLFYDSVTQRGNFWLFSLVSARSEVLFCSQKSADSAQEIC